MLFHSSLRKELSRNFGATLIVLLTIVMTMTLIRTLGQASTGTVNPAEISLVLGLTMLGQLPIILTMSLFISTVGTLSRMYLESEMVIWFVSGKGLRALLKPIFAFAWPIVLTVFALMLIVWPWSNQKISELKIRYEQRGDLQRVAPGQFQESASGLRVFFIDKQSMENKDGKNIFISSSEHNKQAVTSAPKGHIESINNQQFLVLENGQRIEQSATKQDIKVTNFASYSSKIGESHPLEEAPQAKTIPSIQLLRAPLPGNMAELGWRLGVAMSALNVLIIALATTTGNPRVGRGGNLAQALLLFIVYFNLINLGQSWQRAGKVELLPLIFMLHGGVFFTAVFWLIARHNHWDWRRIFQRTPS